MVFLYWQRTAHQVATHTKGTVEDSTWGESQHEDSGGGGGGGKQHNSQQKQTDMSGGLKGVCIVTS
jgi:hypothetical protein